MRWVRHRRSGNFYIEVFSLIAALRKSKEPSYHDLADALEEIYRNA